MSLERIRPVTWRDELVALAGPERFHILAPRLLTPEAPVSELEYVALLCLYHREVLKGRLPHTPDPSIAELWADTVLRLRRRDISD